MAPKKTVDGKTSAAAKKPQKKLKEKPLKPKLRTPTVIRVKLSTTGAQNITGLSPKTAKMPKLTKKQLTAEKKALEKLNLANEVVAAQFAKGQTIKIEPEVILTEGEKTEGVKVPKKRGRKKKVPEPAVTSAESEDAFEPSPVKKKRCTQKPGPKSKKKPDPVKPAKKFSLSLSPKKTPKLSNNTSGNSEVENAQKSSDVSTDISTNKAVATPKSRKSKLNAETGKQKLEDIASNVDQSPSLLNPVDGKLPTENSSDPNVEACLIESRKTSLNSELSWTKDISSSSTTTCVTACSTDIVRIDKKLPVLKLEDIAMKKTDTVDNSSSSSSSSESSDSESDADKANRESTPDMEFRSLDLSTSSITAKSPPSLPSRENSNQNKIINDEMGKASKALDKLTAKLKKFDLEIINWIGYENENVSAEVKRFQGKIFQALKEESEIISQCQQLKRILSSNINIDNVNEIDVNSKVDNENMDIERPNDANTRIDEEKAIEPSSPKNLPSEDDENNFTTDKIKYKSFDQSCDDDDALSLYAESLTGIDTSTYTSRAASICSTYDFEEYIPQIMKNTRRESPKITYTPSRIANDVTMRPTVCEKQNADSTSIYKDTEQDKSNPATLAIQNSNPKTRVPKLMSSYYSKPTYGRLTVIKGTCFFNLLGSCKKGSNCSFPHSIPDDTEITAKLVRLSEEVFIQEYMMLRDWPELRRKYGMCFVQECCRRDLTRILVEMAKDFVMKANDNVREDVILKVEVIECTLLHLNAVDLGLCEDLLMYNIHGVPLCDIFMQAIANTQNFSRFKLVFMKLTKFMLENERTFKLEVATQILERLSILPCERQLLEALLEIVKHTDRRIVENSMMDHFEKQLSKHNDLYEQLLEFKKETSMNRSVLNNLYEMSPRVNKEIEPAISKTLVVEREKRYTSPDTTNLDNLNKTSDDPITAPIVEFNRAGLFNNIKRTFSTNPVPVEERPKIVAKNKPNYKSWKDMSILNTIRALSPGAMQPPRPLKGRHVFQPMSFGRSPPKYPRRPPPDYY